MVFVSAAAALRVPSSLASRRAVLAQGAGVFAALAVSTAADAKVSEIGTSFDASNKEEFYKALAARKEAERIAALPVNQLKVARDRFAGAPALVEKDDWSALRDLMQQTTGQFLTNQVKLIRLSSKELTEVKTLTTKLRKKVFEVDTFAYSQQNFPGSDLFSGYCAEGVVPRGDGGCKLKPSIEKGQWITLLKEAAALYDQIVQLVA